MELETAVTFADTARPKLCDIAAPSSVLVSSRIKRFHFSFIVILRQSKLTELLFISVDTPSNGPFKFMTQHIFKPNSAISCKPSAEI